MLHRYGVWIRWRLCAENAGEVSIEIETDGYTHTDILKHSNFSEIEAAISAVTINLDRDIPIAVFNSANKVTNDCAEFLTVRQGTIE